MRLLSLSLTQSIGPHIGSEHPVTSQITDFSFNFLFDVLIKTKQKNPKPCYY